MEAKKLTENISKSVSQMVQTPEEQEAQFALEKKERVKARNQKYWNETFKKEKKQISGVLTKAEYAVLSKRAKKAGRTPFRQLWEESQGYLKGEYVPPQNIEEILSELDVQVRKIGNNINQIAHHSNRIKRFLEEGKFRREMQNLLLEMRNTTVRLWQAPRESQPDQE